jgi:hypothetical protein
MFSGHGQVDANCSQSAKLSGVAITDINNAIVFELLDGTTTFGD